MHVPLDLQVLQWCNPIENYLIALGVEPDALVFLHQAHDEKAKLIVEGILAWPAPRFEVAIALISRE
jgi:hypothetical protein